jgi:hypothetical protein
LPRMSITTATDLKSVRPCIPGGEDTALLLLLCAEAGNSRDGS